MTSQEVAEVSGSQYTRSEQRRVIAAAGLGWGLEFFDLTLVALLVIPISEDFGITKADLGIVLTAQLVATAFGGILFGWLADKYGRQRVLSWTIWIFGLATAATALSPSLGVFLVLRIITGIGVGGEWAVGFALLNEAWSPTRRGLAGGAVQAAIWPAFAVAIYVTGAVPHWRWAFVVGVLPVIAAIWVRRSCPESKQWLALQRGAADPVPATERSQSEPPGSATDALRALFSGATLRIMVLGTITVFGAQYSYYVYSSWMPTYLKASLGVSAGTAQTVLYVSAGISLVSYVLAGAWSDVIGRRRALLWFAAVQLVAFIAFAFLNLVHGAIPLIIVAYFVISFGLGYFAIFGAWFGELFATPVRARGSSFCYSVGRGFASFGPFIVGLLAAQYGLGGGISTGLIAVALMMAVSCFLPDRSGRVITAAE